MTLVSVVVPTRNGGDYLAHTLDQLIQLELPTDLEIIVVENGSTDSTWVQLQELSESWKCSIPLKITQSRPGLGNAYTAGVQISQGDHVYLTADDLPFGTADLAAATYLTDQYQVIIGSKAHKDSVINRGLLRGALSQSFRLTRTIVLRSTIGDSQGTFIVNGPWLRAFAKSSKEEGFLWTTELVDSAERDGLAIVEIPITFEPRENPTGSRVKINDVANMLIGTFRIRSRRTKSDGGVKK